jgi:transposase
VGTPGVRARLAVVHADETPIALLDSGGGKTRRAYMWAYARGAFEPEPGVVFDFCAGRGGHYPCEFFKGWAGTLVVDAYSGYDAALSLNGRSTAYCLARQGQRQCRGRPGHPAAGLAVQDRGRREGIDRRPAAADAARAVAAAVGRDAWWLKLERTRVPDGSAIAKAIDYSLNHWVGLGRYLLDGDVPIDNNHVENRIRPWALGRRNWLFIGSRLAGERAAVVMSLLQSAKLNGHEPWAYLKDVLTRLPTQLNSRIEELLPHKWQPVG